MSEKLSLIIPVYNEENTLEDILTKVLNTKFSMETEIIIVDDCSKDGSLEKIKKFAEKNKRIKFFMHSKNKGKGSAVKTGIENSNGTIIGIQDSDLEYNPEDINSLIKPILNKRFEVVYGSRFLKNYQYKKNRFYYGNKFLSLFTSIIYLRKITDMETCYKFCRKEVLDGINLKARRFDMEPELTSKIIRKGYKIKEIPIDYNPRTEEQGKKIKSKDGLAAIWTLLKYRFN